jgi:hypothetical protein
MHTGDKKPIQIIRWKNSTEEIKETTWEIPAQLTKSKKMDVK